MAYTPMFEMWRTQLEGEPFDLLLDLGYGEDYPLPTHPWFFGVRIPMAGKTDSGLPSPEEARRLDAVENRIRELIRTRDGLYVGRRTGMANRDLLTYFPERPRGIEDRIRASIGMELLFISRPDPRWEGYQQLIPQAKDWRRIEDQKLIDGLIDAESDPGKVHELLHMVETESPKGAQALAKLMLKLELEDIEVVGDKPDLKVMGVQRVPIDHEMILRVSYNLEKQAPKAKGRYLGWVAEPVGADPEPEDDMDSLVESVLAGMGGGFDDDDDDDDDDDG